MEVNVERSGVMHMRRRGVKRTGETFLWMIRLKLWRIEYKYLGCMVNDQLNCAWMVEKKAKAVPPV